MTEAQKDLRLLMFDALINLMEEARLNKDEEAHFNYSRLVNETWQAMNDDDEEEA
jgi:hypothetical protein